MYVGGRCLDALRFKRSYFEPAGGAAVFVFDERLLRGSLSEGPFDLRVLGPDGKALEEQPQVEYQVGPITGALEVLFPRGYLMDNAIIEVRQSEVSSIQSTSKAWPLSSTLRLDHVSFDSKKFTLY